MPEGTVASAGETTPLQSMYTTLLSVLSGAWPVRLNLEFLYFSNATDLQLLQNMKEAFDARVSMCHSALVMANAFMHAGTTRDTFLRENLEWLKTATNWAMFGATASLGVIHHGHLGKVCARTEFDAESHPKALVVHRQRSGCSIIEAWVA